MLNQLWTTAGLLRKYGDRSVCLRHPMIVEPFDHCNGDCQVAIQAGLVELSVRIGLECLFVPTPLLGNVFVNKTVGVPLKKDGIQAVFGFSRDWLAKTLAEFPGASLQEFIRQFDCLNENEGMLSVLDSGLLVGASKSGLGLLSVMRALASDNFGHGLPPNTSLVVGEEQTQNLRVVNSADPVRGDTENATRDVGLTTCVRPLTDARRNTDAIPNTDIAQSPEMTPSSDATPPIQLFNLFSNIGGENTRTIFPQLNMQFRMVATVDPLENVISLSARLGLEVERVTFPFTCLEGESVRQSAVQVQFRIDENETVGCVSRNGQVIEFAAPSSESLRDMLDDVTASWFDLPDDVNQGDWRGRVAAATSVAPDIRNRALSELLLTHHAIQNGGIETITVPSHLQKAVDPWSQSHGVQLSVSPEPLLLRLDWQGKTEWELMKSQLICDLNSALEGVSHDVLHGDLYRVNDDGEEQGAAIRSRIADVEIQVELFTTVPKNTFEQDVEQLLKSEGMSDLEGLNFTYRNVTKSGLDWFLSDILPSLRDDTSIFTIEISARKVEGRFLDLPQRYLQEFFPIDAILEREIGLPRDRVHLHLHDDEGSTYIVSAKNEEGKVQRQWMWDSLTETRAYMPTDESTLVLVPAAGYRISIHNHASGSIQVASSNTVPTVYTQFWDWYQKQVIPGVLSADRSRQGPTAFSRLEVELWVDGTEESHGVYEEVVSWPESAHEDIYFYTLHAFQKHSQATNASEWKSPGLVVPLVHSEGNPPHAEIRLFDYQSQELVLYYPNRLERELIEFKGDVEFVPAEINRLIFESGGWKVVPDNFVLEHVASDRLEREQFVHDESALEQFVPDTLSPDPSSDSLPVESILAWLNGPSTLHEASGLIEESRLDTPGLPLSLADNEIRVLQNNDVIAWLNRHRNELPGRHFIADYSFQGRPIVGIELQEPVPGLTSRTKHALFKPSLLIFARHHANEVSSTNSALGLVNDVMENREQLSQFNLVIVPVHNTDGAALHQSLMEEHPYWKHHAARFNACGYEFGHDYFKPDTQFGESRVAARLWGLWKPDIVLDDHGIPSHEWIQPFSGYNSPPLFPESYWIPHAQIYTIWRELNPESQLDESGLVLTVARALNEDSEIRSRNEEFLARYRKWGQQFSPRKFPASAVDSVITYRWKVTPSDKSTSHIGRFPDWVTADIITEVNDETVHGKALCEVVHAHSRAHEGILAWLSRTTTKLNRSYDAQIGHSSIRLERDRPLS